MTTISTSNTENTFNAHLDGCHQCEERPFDLCAEGEKLLVQEGQKLVLVVRLDDDGYPIEENR